MQEGAIEEFRNEYRWLSNFWKSQFVLERKTCMSVEHWYQAHKTPDPHIAEAIRQLPSPGQAKKMGKGLVLRDDWEAVKDQIMCQGVEAKFSQDLYLRQRLIDTGDVELIEGNFWGDTYWGICKGAGLNKLGKLLMKVRKELCDITSILNSSSIPPASTS